MCLHWILYHRGNNDTKCRFKWNVKKYIISPRVLICDLLYRLRLRVFFNLFFNNKYILLKISKENVQQFFLILKNGSRFRYYFIKILCLYLKLYNFWPNFFILLQNLNVIIVITLFNIINIHIFYFIYKENSFCTVLLLIYKMLTLHRTRLKK